MGDKILKFVITFSKKCKKEKFKFIAKIIEQVFMQRYLIFYCISKYVQYKEFDYEGEREREKRKRKRERERETEGQRGSNMFAQRNWPT